MRLAIGRSTDVMTKSPSPYSNTWSPTTVRLAPCATMPSRGSLTQCTTCVGTGEIVARTPASAAAGSPGRAWRAMSDWSSASAEGMPRLKRGRRTIARVRCTESARLAGSCNQSPARCYRPRGPATHHGALSTKGSPMSKTWFTTGASRGLGADIAAAALKAGDNVVATGRQRSAVSDKLGADNEHLLSLALDVSDAAQARAAVAKALERFGAIDVLVNNAGYGHLGYFEETTDADIQAQYATNVFGLFNVTRAALPAMRAARQGHVFNLSSVAGYRGVEAGSLYCSSKFAVEGFSEALAGELAPFGIHVTIIEPGPFRTDFLTPESLRFIANEVPDYAERRNATRASFEGRNGTQQGDP